MCLSCSLFERVKTGPPERFYNHPGGFCFLSDRFLADDDFFGHQQTARRHFHHTNPFRPVFGLNFKLLVPPPHSFSKIRRWFRSKIWTNNFSSKTCFSTARLKINRSENGFGARPIAKFSTPFFPVKMTFGSPNPAGFGTPPTTICCETVQFLASFKLKMQNQRLRDGENHQNRAARAVRHDQSIISGHQILAGE